MNSYAVAIGLHPHQSMLHALEYQAQKANTCLAGKQHDACSVQGHKGLLQTVRSLSISTKRMSCFTIHGLHFISWTVNSFTLISKLLPTLYQATATFQTC